MIDHLFVHLKGLKNYEPGVPIEEVVAQFGIGPDKIIKLGSNENPYGVSPKVIQRLREWVPFSNRYPDDSYRELKKGLGKRFGVPVENIIIGLGSDQILELAVRAVRPKKVLTAGITFAMYEIFAKMEGAEVIKTPSPTHNLEQFWELYNREKPELIFICTPNNPLGEALDREELLRFSAQVTDSLIVIDGAYQEFARFKDPKKWIEPIELIGRKNVLYTGTFSKAFGLGGLRVGYGIGNRFIIENLSKLRPPFNVSTLSAIGASEALKDMEWVEKGIVANFKEMERYCQFARQWNLDYFDSYTNFIVLKIPNSDRVTDFLLKKGIIVRNMKGYGFDALRITIGTPEQNSICLRTLNEYLSHFVSIPN